MHPKNRNIELLAYNGAGTGLSTIQSPFKKPRQLKTTG